MVTAVGDAADALVESLRQRGFRAYATPARAGSGVGTVFRVRVGPYVTTEDAIAEGERLRLERDIREATVVSD
jgi:cell division septation protein DedD